MIRGSLLRLVLAAVAAADLCACATADLKLAPDAGADACTSQAVAFCSVIEAGAPGCVAAATAPSETIKKLPPGTYPVGCSANLVGPDLNGECKLVTTCTCNTPPEVDAGDAGEAGSPAGPPAWQCDR